MKSKIVYLLVVLYAFYIAVMYDGIFPFLFLLFLLILPLFGIVEVMYMKRVADCAISTESSLVSKEQGTSIDIEIKNRGCIPMPFLRFLITQENGNKQLKQSSRMKINGMADAKSSETFACRIRPRRCGKLRVCMKEIRFFDYLCLVTKRSKVGQELVITVLPEIYQMKVRMSELTAGFVIDGEEFSKVKSGEDSSEIFDVREYRAGDRPQRIHWKMTARTGELMVKEFSQPLGNKVVLFLDLQMEHKSKNNYFIPDSFFEVVFSLSHALISEEISHFVVWFQEGEGRIGSRNIRSEEDVFQMISTLFEEAPYTEDYFLIRHYHEIYGQQSYCTGISLDLSLNLQVGEQEIIRIPENKIQETLADLIVEV